MRVQFTSIFLLFSILATAQENVFLNSWQYIDKNGDYHELTISKKKIYMYTDSGGVERYNSKVRYSKISFNKENWIIQNSDSLSISVTVDKGDTIKLYKLESLGNELIDFYEWANAKYRNGNGYMILWREATERKMALLQKCKSH
jgi:hypothetical protein